MKKNYYLEIEEDEEQIQKKNVNNNTENSNNLNRKNQLDTPKHSRPYSIQQNTKKRKKKKNIINYKLLIIIIIIALIYILYEPFLNFIQELLKLNPTIYKYYIIIESKIINNTIEGLIMISILGSLFFLTIPSEALFIYYLNSTEYNYILLISLMLIGNLIGLIFNYSIGRLIGKNAVKYLFNKNYEKYKEKIDKYGGFVLVVGNIIPGPIEVLTLFFGAFKFNFNTYVYLCFIGRLVKYLIILVLFIFFWEEISWYTKEILESFLILKTEIFN